MSWKGTLYAFRPDVADLPETSSWADTRIVLDTATAEVSETNRGHVIKSEHRKSELRNVLRFVSGI